MNNPDRKLLLDAWEKSIRADERRNFAETLAKVNWEVIKDNVDIQY